VKREQKGAGEKRESLTGSRKKTTTRMRGENREGDSEKKGCSGKPLLEKNGG